MKKNSQNTSIRVFCRVRPLNALEISEGGECCVEYTEKNIKVKVNLFKFKEQYLISFRLPVMTNPTTLVLMESLALKLHKLKFLIR